LPSARRAAQRRKRDLTNRSAERTARSPRLSRPCLADLSACAPRRRRTGCRSARAQPARSPPAPEAGLTDLDMLAGGFERIDWLQSLPYGPCRVTHMCKASTTYRLPRAPPARPPSDRRRAGRRAKQRAGHAAARLTSGRGRELPCRRHAAGRPPTGRCSHHLVSKKVASRAIKAAAAARNRPRRTPCARGWAGFGVAGTHACVHDGHLLDAGALLQLRQHLGRRAAKGRGDKVFSSVMVFPRNHRNTDGTPM